MSVPSLPMTLAQTISVGGTNGDEQTQYQRVDMPVVQHRPPFVDGPSTVARQQRLENCGLPTSAGTGLPVKNELRSSQVANASRRVTQSASDRDESAYHLAGGELWSSEPGAAVSEKPPDVQECSTVMAPVVP